MPAVPVVFSFANATTADGNRFAGSLAETLRDIDPDIRVERIRGSAKTHRIFGASLAVVLGTAVRPPPLPRGIAAWLARNSGAKLEILREGQVVMRAGHLDSADVPKLAQALRAAGL